MITGMGVPSPGFQFGFCCVTLGRSLPLSGCLSYEWTRFFQRSLKTVIPCTCPRLGDCPSGASHHPTLLFRVPGAPGRLRGRGLAMPPTPPGPSSSTTDLPTPRPLPPHDRQASPLREGGGPPWLLSFAPAVPYSGHPGWWVSAGLELQVRPSRPRSHGGGSQAQLL